MEITHENWKALKPSAWVSVGYILSPDRKLLQDSLTRYGWLQPIVCRVQDKTIIDGYSRWVIAAENEMGDVPVMWVDCDEIDAMILHITLNRARGNILNKELSQLVKRLIRSQKYDDDFLRIILRMTPDEFDLLADGTLVKVRKVGQHKYNKAWVPVETAGTAKPATIAIERPPGDDG